MMFLVSVAACLFLGATFALLIRTELTLPGPTIMNETTAKIVSALSVTETQITPQQMYNRVFTLHGAIMIFLFIIPAIPAALGNFVLPLLLGAKDVAFPRLNLVSFYLFFFGALFFVLTLLLGGIDTGWTFYTPYSVETGTAVTTAVTGAFILGFSSIFTGLNFLVTIHTLRPPGMTWFKMPLFLWALYAHGHHPGAGHAGAGHHAAAAGRGADVRRRHLRSDAGRRPDPVPALLLVLFPSGRVHHDPAGDGDHQRGDLGLQPQAHFRLPVHRLQQHRHRAVRLPGVGTSHVRQRAVARWPA